MVYRLGRDHPVAAHGVFDVDVMALHNGVQLAPWQAQHGAQFNLDPRADIGFLGLFQFLVGPPPRLGRHDHIIDTAAQHRGEMCRQCLGAACTRGDVGGDGGQQRVIAVGWGDDAVGKRLFHRSRAGTGRFAPSARHRAQHTFAQGLGDLGRHGVCHGRRKGVADLPVSVGFRAGKVPVVGKALNARHHGHGQAGHSLMQGIGRFGCDGAPLDAQRGPCGARAGGAKVGAAVFL